MELVGNLFNVSRSREHSMEHFYIGVLVSIWAWYELPWYCWVSVMTFERDYIDCSAKNQSDSWCSLVKMDEKTFKFKNEIFNFHVCICICSGESELSKNVPFNYACPLQWGDIFCQNSWSRCCDGGSVDRWCVDTKYISTQDFKKLSMQNFLSRISNCDFHKQDFWQHYGCPVEWWLMRITSLTGFWLNSPIFAWEVIYVRIV